MKCPTAAVLIGVVFAGCGGGYTRADFIQRADGICTASTRAIRLLTPPQFGASSELQRRSSVAYLTHAASLVGQEARKLSALPTPPESATQRALRLRWLADVRASSAELRALAKATSAGDKAAVSSANATLAANPVVELAGQYGAHACAGPGATYK